MTVKRRPLGRTGLNVSEIGLGCWQLGGDWGPVTQHQANAILAAADEAGVTFWDTADVYGDGQSEQFIGEYVAQHASPERVIVTKAGRTDSLFPDTYNREALRRCAELSRERLQTDSLDLLQLHCIPFTELKRGYVFEWLEELKSDGVIKHYGASVETTEEARYCLEHTEVASLQIIFNVLRQEMVKEVLPQAEAKNVGIIVRLGLASGLLGGHMTKSQTFTEQDHRHFNKDGAAFHVGETFSGLPFETGVELADALKAYTTDISLAELSLRWILDHAAVSSIITGASRPEQIIRNAGVSELPPLSSALHQQLSEFYYTQVKQHIRGII